MGPQGDGTIKVLLRAREQGGSYTGPLFKLPSDRAVTPAHPKNSEMVGSGLEPATPGSEASTQPTEPPDHHESGFYFKIYGIWVCYINSSKMNVVPHNRYFIRCYARRECPLLCNAATWRVHWSIGFFFKAV